MRLALTAACLLALPATAFAQGEAPAAAAPKAPATCAELLETFGSFQMMPNGKVEDTATGCHVTGVYFLPNSAGRMKADELTLNAPGLFKDFATDRLPAEVDLTVKGLQNSPDTGSPLMTYMVEMQTDPMELHLAYRWDREARTVELADLSLSSERGSFSLAGRFSNTELDPSKMNAVDAMPGAIEQLTLKLENARFFTSLVFPVVISALPQDQDPRPIVASAIKTANAFIAALPAEHVSDDTKAALTSFVSDFPRPSGDYTLEMRADPPLPFSEFKGSGLAAFENLLARLNLSASHTPAP